MEVYDLAWRSPFLQREIGELYGICQPHVSDIKNGECRTYATEHDQKAA